MGLWTNKKTISSSPKGPRGGKFDTNLTLEIEKIVESYLSSGTGNGGIYEGSGTVPSATIATLADTFSFTEDANNFWAFKSGAYPTGPPLTNATGFLTNLTGNYHGTSIVGELSPGNYTFFHGIIDLTDVDAVATVSANLNGGSDAITAIYARNASTGGISSVTMTAESQNIANLPTIAISTIDHANVRRQIALAGVSGNGITIGDPVGGTSYTIPWERGTNNQVLKTDGSGLVTWQDITITLASPTTYTPTGTTETITFSSTDPTAILDLGSATGDVTLTINGMEEAGSYVIKVIQGATPYDVIFPAATIGSSGNTAWTAGTNTLDISTTDDAIDVVGLTLIGGDIILTSETDFS